MRREKRDANHKEVMGHLRRCGVDVIEILKPLDLLCHRQSVTSFVEVKLPGSAAKWTAVQLRFISETRFNVIVAKSGESALESIRNRRFVSQAQKDCLAALLCLEPKKVYTPKEIDVILCK